ncbi:carbohydrate sulfotransferase 3 [Exaiptasia diaphana]|uniref:Sulfotransferase n=1 Tax=Exaiptasia diaphana TaxID=2652724 RepID=A0A913WUW6_EXADI|nr:carbohydrate sulfotransferase 3 [Exaiptasia diaphana]
MAKLWFMSSFVCAIFLSYKLFNIFTNEEFYLMRSSSTKLDYGSDMLKCDIDVQKVLDRVQRIDLVRSFLMEKKQFSPRENVLVFGVPGALSELVGAVIGGESGVFYLPSALQSRAYYISHDPTLAIPITIDLLEKIFNCNFEDELLLESLVQNRTALYGLKLPSCVSSRDNIFKNTSYSNACTEEVSDWMSKKCRQNTLTVLQTDKLKSISYLEVLTTEIKSRKFNIRVLYVVRDPRAIISDTFEESQLNLEKVQVFVDRMCTRMRMDLQIAQSSPIWQQERYKLVKIEEFIRNSSVLSAAYNHTNESFWQVKMPSKTRQVVEQRCAKVLDMLGYLK